LNCHPERSEGSAVAFQLSFVLCRSLALCALRYLHQGQQMKDKQFIIGEIQRTALLRGGEPLGQKAFREETGITEYEWQFHWARWSDALVDAGFEPLEWNTALDEERMLRSLASLVRKYNRYPVNGEIQIESRKDATVPVPNTLRRRLGERTQIISKLREFCDLNTEFADVSAILVKEPIRTESSKESKGSIAIASADQKSSGYVYLVKSGKLYKIGCSENHWRRKGELHKQTAEGITEIHTIAAIDDPQGIERYWHERFAAKRLHGEWFDLSAEDISAFKKRKFM
jgi:hypothetical protein